MLASSLEQFPGMKPLRRFYTMLCNQIAFVGIRSPTCIQIAPNVMWLPFSVIGMWYELLWTTKMLFILSHLILFCDLYKRDECIVGGAAWVFSKTDFKKCFHKFVADHQANKPASGYLLE